MSDINRIRSNINNYYNKKKEEHYKEYSKKKNDKWNKYYSSSEWHLLRNAYYVAHPLCEMHEKYGIIKPATSVHHYHPFSKGITEEAKWKLLLCPQNLCSCCESCHKEFHRQLIKKNLDCLKEIVPVEFQNEKYI